MTFHYKQTVIFMESIKSIFPFRHLWWGGVHILKFFVFFLKSENQLENRKLLPEMAPTPGSFVHDFLQKLSKMWPDALSSEVGCTSQRGAGALSHGTLELGWCRLDMPSMRLHTAPSWRSGSQGCAQPPPKRQLARPLGPRESRWAPQLMGPVAGQ